MNRRGWGEVSLADRWALIHEEEYRKKVQFGQILATASLNHSRDLDRATERTSQRSNTQIHHSHFHYADNVKCIISGGTLMNATSI